MICSTFNERGPVKSARVSRLIDEMMGMFNVSAADWCGAIRLQQGQRCFWRPVIHAQLHRQPTLLYSLGGFDFIPAADFAPFGSYFREKMFVDLCRLLPPGSAG